MTRRTSTKQKDAIANKETQETCVHHWLIDYPSGPESKGVCKKCGAEKDFVNNLPLTWEKGKDSLS